QDPRAPEGSDREGAPRLRGAADERLTAATRGAGLTVALKDEKLPGMAATTAIAARPRVIESFEAALTKDITRPLPFAVLSLVYFAVRIPLARYGFGTDPDSWRVALTGHYLLAHGQYYPSRLPGYPLQEFVVAPFTLLGSFAVNLETAAAALIGVYIFGRIVLWLGLPRPALLTIGFAFTPLLIINSV